MPTTDGAVWFKAAAPAFAHEGAVLRVLEPLAPDLLPTVLATTDDGWLLLEDAGERAREHGVDWDQLAERYATLQRAAEAKVEELLAAGAYDNRPAEVRASAERLLPCLPDDVAGQLEERLDELDADMARLDRAPTIDHGDLHDANVFSRAGRVRIIDWGDSAVAHPFFSLTVSTSEEARAYLAHWDDSEEEAAIVERNRFLLRALNWQHVAEFGPPWSGHLVEQVERFLATR